MGYLLLWVESLALTLSIVAFVVACAARVSGPKKRLLVWLPATAFFFLVYLSITVFLGYVKFWRMPGLPWYFPTLWLFLLYTAGAAYLRITGLRRREEDFVAASWPRGKIGASLLIVLSVHFMTFWNLDAEAKQRIVMVRAQAEADSLSTAPLQAFDRDNAALMYAKLGQATDVASLPAKWKKWDEWLNADAEAFKEADAEISEFLAKQAGVVAALQEASKKPACVFPHNYHWRTIDALAPEMKELTRNARLLQLHARWSVVHSDTQAALRDVSAINGITRHVTQNPHIISLLVGVAIENKALDALQNALNAGASETAMASLEPAQLSFQALYPVALRSERASYFAAITRLADGDAFWLEKMPSPAVAQTIYRVFLAPLDFEAGEVFYQRVCNQSHLSFLDAKKVQEDAIDELRSTGSLLLQMFLPALPKVHARIAAGDACIAVMELATAAHRYQLKNGKLPDSLDDLVPDFIPFVPVDPFGGKLMKYRKTDDGVVIYSVGPDGKDDGGEDLDKKKQNGDVSFRLKALTTGKK